MYNGREVQRLIYTVENRQCRDQEPPCHVFHGRNLAVRLDGAVPLRHMQWVRDVMGNRWLYTNKRMFEELKEYMVDFHKTGAKLFVQLAAGCGRSMGVNHLMSMMLDHPALGKVGKFVMDAEYLCASASATPNRWNTSPVR